MLLDGALTLGAGALFIIMYLFEDAKTNLGLKYVWLFAGIAFLAFGFYGLMQLNTTSTLTPAHSVTTTGITSNVPLFCGLPLPLYDTQTFYLQNYVTGALSPYYVMLHKVNTTLGVITTRIPSAVYLPVQNGIFLVKGWSTNATEPNLNHVSMGETQVDIDAYSNGTARLFAQVWVVNSTGAALYLVGQSPQTPLLNGYATQYVETFINNYTFSIKASDRKVILIYANVTNSGVPISISLVTGGLIGAHLTFPVLNNTSPITACPTTTEVSSSTVVYQATNNTITNNYAPDTNSYAIGTVIGVLLTGCMGYFLWKIFRGIKT